jgi:hypothetical protein
MSNFESNHPTGTGYIITAIASPLLISILISTTVPFPFNLSGYLAYPIITWITVKKYISMNKNLGKRFYLITAFNHIFAAIPIWILLRKTNYPVAKNNAIVCVCSVIVTGTVFVLLSTIV